MRPGCLRVQRGAAWRTWKIWTMAVAKEPGSAGTTMFLLRVLTLTPASVGFSSLADMQRRAAARGAVAQDKMKRVVAALLRARPIWRDRQ